ncbi:MAG: LacI family DNA-binding transcriptional regulator, partial [Armatimonadetes bacterium]|nr:LacI family DNA-binding transcriptional regulator [Armatimonadota bacterium]
MATTLKDVAKEAGVALSTASRVLQGDPHPMISEGTRERVLAVARRLDYRRNVHARNLRLGRSEALGLLVYDLDRGLSLSRLRAAERVMAAKGYRSVLCDAAGRLEVEADGIKEMVGGLVDGVMVLSASGEGIVESLALLVERGVPLVTFEPFEALPADCVAIDLESGGYQAARHLLELGHRRIGAVLGTAGRATRERLEGYRRAMREFDCELDEALLEPVVEGTGATVYDRGYVATQRLLARRPLPTALLCNNDEVAIAAIKAMSERGLRVPEDLAVVGFDDIPVATYLSVPLTTLAQPVTEQA